MEKFNDHHELDLLLPSRKRDKKSYKAALHKHFKLLFFLAFLITALFSNQLSYSQVAENTDWKLLKESEGVKAYYMISNCSSKDYLHLKIQNIGSSETKLIWVVNIKNGESYSTTPTMPIQVLKAGGEIISDCNNISPILSIPLDKPDHSTLTFNLILLP
jgi:hypothetical protein